MKDLGVIDTKTAVKEAKDALSSSVGVLTGEAPAGGMVNMPGEVAPGMNDMPDDDNYYTYALRTMSYKDRVDFIDYILNDKLEGKDIGLVIIDGIADLVADVNNLEQCNEAIQKLMSWTDELQCHIVTIIHSNYGSDKPTGHLGSFLEKKAETQIKLEKNGVNQGWITVECKRSRNKSFETFSFTINEKGLPEFVDNDIDL